MNFIQFYVDIYKQKKYIVFLIPFNLSIADLSVIK